MEARFVQSWLEKRLRGASIFLDSDSLKDLNQLGQHVRDSAVLVLIQSKMVLSRPYCVLELLTAIKHEVPIVGLNLVGGNAAYDFEDAAFWLSNLDSLWEDNDYAINLLQENGWDDLTEVAYLLSTVVPARISVPLQPGASAATIDATLEDLLQSMNKAEPTVVARDLPGHYPGLLLVWGTACVWLRTLASSAQAPLHARRTAPDRRS